MPIQIFSARVRGGTIVPEDGVTLPEGATVTVIANDDRQPFEVTAKEESRAKTAALAYGHPALVISVRQGGNTCLEPSP
jgi:hypothetical protein